MSNTEKRPCVTVQPRTAVSVSIIVGGFEIICTANNEDEYRLTVISKNNGEVEVLS